MDDWILCEDAHHLDGQRGLYYISGTSYLEKSTLTECSFLTNFQ